MPKELSLTCEDCGAAFAYKQLYGEIPKRCRTCRDRRRGLAPLLSSDELFRHVPVAMAPMMAVVLRSGAWFGEVKPSWRRVLKGPADEVGAWHGVQWEGRLDLYVHLDHAGRHAYRDEKPSRDDLLGLTYECTVAQTKRERQNTMTQVHLRPVGEDETRDAEPLVLEYASVHHKTTLKGFGRDRYGEITIPETAAWSWECSNACRSGRFGNRAVVALTRPDEPLAVEQN